MAEADALISPATISAVSCIPSDCAATLGCFKERPQPLDELLRVRIDVIENRLHILRHCILLCNKIAVIRPATICAPCYHSASQRRRTGEDRQQ